MLHQQLLAKCDGAFCNRPGFEIVGRLKMLQFEFSSQKVDFEFEALIKKIGLFKSASTSKFFAKCLEFRIHLLRRK